MTDIVLRNVDPLLADRIRRVAEAHGWAPQTALVHLLETGLFSVESDMAARFSDTDANALQAAISALEQLPSDPGFAQIGRPNGFDHGGAKERNGNNGHGHGSPSGFWGSD